MEPRLRFGLVSETIPEAPARGRRGTSRRLGLVSETITRGERGAAVEPR